MGVPLPQSGLMAPPPPTVRTGWQLNTLCRGRYASWSFPQEDFLVLNCKFTTGQLGKQNNENFIIFDSWIFIQAS